MTGTGMWAGMRTRTRTRTGTSTGTGTGTGRGVGTGTRLDRMGEGRESLEPTK